MTGNHRLSRRDFAAAALATGIAGGLGRPSRAQETPNRGGTLIATWGGGEPQACYVPTGGGPSPTLTSSKLFERLATRAADGRFEGRLAESWKPAPDFKSYMIKLRQGVRFHDGRTMTAEDIAYSISDIWRKYAVPAMLRDLARVEAPNASTVIASFTVPVPGYFFGALLCAPVSYIVPRHVYAGSDPLANPANDAPIGTGPWKFKDWVRGSHFEYVKNEDYWRKGLPYLDRLVIRYVRAPEDRAAAIESGEIQLGVLDPVARSDISRLTATGEIVATSKGYDEIAWATTLVCNVRRPVFAKREVRQAMFLAIDRDLIARTIYGGYARPGSGPIFSSNTTFFTPGTYDLDFDPARAAALLDGAGLPRPKAGKRFGLTLVAGGWFPANGKVGAYAKQALEDIGIGVDLVVPDRSASIERIYTDYDFDLAISNECNPTEPVPTTTHYFTSDGIAKGMAFANASGFHTDEVDALVDKIRIETDPGKRHEELISFQKIVSREAANLPLVERESITLASRTLRNHSETPDFPNDDWADLWLES
jgi:peptide/nickel transport system substrate-binding protein